MSEIEITQADRDLAGWFTRRIAGGGLYDEQAAKLIAKHRHEARAEALEEAAKAIEGDGVVIPLATAFVPLIIGHNQPCMSGDMRDRLTPHKRRQFDDAVRDFATAIRALRTGSRQGKEG